MERFSEPNNEEELELYENLLGLGGFVEELNSETADLFARTIEINRKRRYFHSFLDHLMRELGAEPDTGYGDLSLRSAPAPGRTTQASFRTLDLQA